MWLFESIDVLILFLVFLFLVALLSFAWFKQSVNGRPKNLLHWWATKAVIAAFQVTVEMYDEGMVDAFPEGEVRRDIAQAYYDLIPEDEKLFTLDQFCQAVQIAYDLAQRGKDVLLRAAQQHPALKLG